MGVRFEGDDAEAEVLVESASFCQIQCERTPGCAGFTYNSRRCRLKADGYQKVNDIGGPNTAPPVSGSKSCWEAIIANSPGNSTNGS